MREMCSEINLRALVEIIGSITSAAKAHTTDNHRQMGLVELKYTICEMEQKKQQEEDSLTEFNSLKICQSSTATHEAPLYIKTATSASGTSVNKPSTAIQNSASAVLSPECPPAPSKQRTPGGGTRRHKIRSKSKRSEDDENNDGEDEDDDYHVEQWRRESHHHCDEVRRNSRTFVAVWRKKK